MKKNPIIEPETPAAVAGAAPCSALFVGGENDGRRIMVEPLERIRLPLPPEKQKGFQMETEDYCIELLRTQHAEFGFYRSTRISLEEAIRRLFAHYTPNDPSSGAPAKDKQP